jgi:WD40 repeat protein
MPNAEAETQVAPTARPVRRQRIRIKEIARFPHGAGVAIVVFSPDGRMLASAGNERIVQVRDGLTGSLLGGLEHGPVTFIRALAFSPDSRWLVTGSDDWGVRRWDLGNATAHRFRERSLPGDQTSVKANHKDVHDVRFSADGRYLASAGGESEAQVRVWDITRKAGATILKHPATVRAVAFHPGGLLLATGGDDKAARMWDISTSKELAKVSWSAFFDWQTNVVTFSPDGRWVASGGQTEILRLWEPRTGKVRKELAVGAWVKSTQFSPDGRFIVTGGQGNNGQIWDVSLAKQLAVLKHSGTVNCVAYRADGQYIATASDDATVRIWESPTGKEVAHLTHEGGVKHVAFNPAAAAMIATGSSDKTARLWKVPI